MKKLLIKQLVPVLLNNCPFCQSDNLSTKSNDNPDFCIKCNNCGAQGPNLIDAITGWNTATRLTEDAVRAAVKDAIDKLDIKEQPVTKSDPAEFDPAEL